MNQNMLMSMCLWTILGGAWSQVIVSEGDLPQGGTDYTFQNVTLDPLLNVEDSGPGWVWDFSELTPTDSSVVEVQPISAASFATGLLFNSPWNSTYQADHFYPFLNLPDLSDVGLPVNIENVLGYHQIDNGMYTQVGLGMTVSGFEIPVAFDDVDEVHPVPLTASATHNSTAAYTVQVPQTLTYVVDQQREAHVDGYGTLLLPDGTSHEVLRMKSTILSDDSVYLEALGQGFAFQRETVMYSWLGDGGMPWMEVMTTLGIPAVMRYQGTIPPSEPVDTTETNEVWDRGVPGLTLYPNPAQQGTRVRLFEGNGFQPTWTLHTLTGEVALRGREAWIDTHGLPQGVYLLREEASGQTHRLVIHR